MEMSGDEERICVRAAEIVSAEGNSLAGQDDRSIYIAISITQ
jgi:hypothetical protein